MPTNFPKTALEDAPSPAALSLAAGTYGDGRGLCDLRRALDGVWHVGRTYPAAPNASFSAFSARHRLHYIVEENAVGRVGVHRHDDNGWEKITVVPAGGAAPCHVALDPSETLLAVANYAGGSIALLRLDPKTGLPFGDPQVHANRGSGPDVERQGAPHAHWVGFSPDGHWLYQTDLGTDQVLAFAIAGDGTLGMPRIAYTAPSGAGPRHLLLHPRRGNRAYLANELANTLTTLDRHEDATFAAKATLSTLPTGWHGESILAHLAINAAGTRLYVSNRGHDSIAVFALDADGVPTLLEHVASGGASPRFFLLLETAGVMVVAHERAQTVTALAIAADGRLTPTDVVLQIPGVGYVLDTDPS